MTFFLDVSDEAKHRLRKLKKKDPELTKRILKKFDLIIKNPYHYEVLKGDLHDARKAPVGDKYRIIFDIHEDEKSVIILLFGHRKDIYTKNELFKAFQKSKKRR
ncbi:type II toxin-antitoxin system RelE family toxin [Methanobacterium formicicum]|jgi:addiction module RelE/StbE family toxin|uniref:Type II toxin-antitoxin system mRNA interferase toxin, RelE/StbE family n=1 Tax=Methanobacterium formicicum TaxID=2162 RepID=A0A843ARX7_METFO|nr:type II toxin-antitoxin system mRNA interferase toxin, RelE/StbE family [Methanobacterium formicicum]MBF4475920.1 type II toxin-antitoxin system mRNA interferase toxin, RelE/StbE family [Methanobacterium formicicum]